MTRKGRNLKVMDKKRKDFERLKRKEVWQDIADAVSRATMLKERSITNNLYSQINNNDFLIGK